MTDLNTVYQAIGGLQQSVANLEKETDYARQRDAQIFAKLDAIGTKIAGQSDIPKRLLDVESEVNNFRVTRRFLKITIGACGTVMTGLVAVAAHVSGAFK